MKKQDFSDSGGFTRRPEKMTILTLIGLTAVLILFILILVYTVPYYGFSGIHAQLPILMGIIVAVFGGAVLLNLLLLMVVIALGRDVPLSKKLRSLAVKGFLPVLTVVGRLVGFKKQEVQHAFVAVNNELVLAQCRNGHPPQRILLLMPHRLQNADCPVKITYRVENCKRCGKCRIKDLLELAEKYDVSLAVATGGTIARKIVIERRPDLIIAVACERDLTSGIQDTTPLPVYGIFNQRPFGPCFNTQVAIDHVESVLKEMVAMRREGS